MFLVIKTQHNSDVSRLNEPIKKREQVLRTKQADRKEHVEK